MTIRTPLEAISDRLPRSVRAWARPIRDSAVDTYRLAVVGARSALTRAEGRSLPAPVFIVGSGRSGTHWLAHILEAHPDTVVTFEEPHIYRLVERMALDPSTARSLFSKLVLRYRYEIVSAAPKVYVDKSHPNIWLVEDLLKTFPDARFIGIHRSVYGTVASMLKHPGARRWAETWSVYPVPNRYLGIDEETASIYGELPLASQCALRWRAHSSELQRLGTLLGPKLLMVSYEALQTSTAAEVLRIEQFLQVARPIPTPDVRSGSLDRWESELGPDVREQIRDIVGDE